MSEFHSDTKSIGLRRNLSNASLSISTTVPPSSDYFQRELDSSLSLSSEVPRYDGSTTSPIQLSAEYVASARQHKPLRDRLLQLDQQNELNTIKLVALREEKEKRSDQFRRELAEAEKDYFMRQNTELRQVLEKKNIEIAEFVELITNLNGIVLHLKSLTSNLKEEVQQYEVQVGTLTADGEKMRIELVDRVKVEAEMKETSNINEKKISDLEIANSDFKKKVKEDKAAIETLQSENKVKAEQLDKIEAELVGCKKQLAETDAKCISQQSELDRLVLLVRMSSGVKEQMESSLQEAQMNADRLALECNELSSRLDSYLALEEKQRTVKEAMESSLMETADVTGKLLRVQESHRGIAEQMEKIGNYELEIEAARLAIRELTSSRDELQLQFDFARGQFSNLLEEKESTVRDKDEIIKTLETQIRELSLLPSKSETVFTAESKQVGPTGFEPTTFRVHDEFFESILKEMDEAIHTHTASLVLLLGNDETDEVNKPPVVSEDGKSESEANNTALASGAVRVDLTSDKKKLLTDINKEFLAFAARIVEIRKYCADMLVQQRSSANLTPSASSSVVVFSEVDDIGEQLQTVNDSNNPSTNSALPSALVNPTNIVSFEYTPGNENLELWEMREQVDKTDKTLRNVINDLQRAEEEKLSLERSVAELHAQLSELQLRMEEKVRLNDKCSDRAMLLQEACDSLRSQNAVLHTNIVTQQAQYSTLEANSLKYIEEIEVLTRDLEISRQKLSQEHECMAANSLKSGELIDSLSRDLENNKKRLLQYEADMAAHSLKSADEIDTLTRDLENSRKQLTQYQENSAVHSLKLAEEKEILSRDLENCKKELSQCLADMAAHSLKSAEQIAGLSRDLETCRNQATQFQDNMVANSEENENLSLELENCRAQLSQCMADAAAHSLKSADEIDTLTRDLETCRKQLSQYQENIVSNSLKSAEENEILSRELENRKKELYQYQENSLKSADAHTALSRDLENSRKQISQCQADITAAMGLSSDLTAKLQRQGQELKTAKEENNRLKMDMEVVSEDLKAQIAVKDGLIQSHSQQELTTAMASSLSEQVMFTSIASAVTSRLGEAAALKNASIVVVNKQLEELKQEKALLAQGLQVLKRDAFRIASSVNAMRNEIVQTSEAILKSADLDSMRAQLLRAVALLEERTAKAIATATATATAATATTAAAATSSMTDLKERDAEIARLSRSERVLSDTLKQKEQQLLQLLRQQEDALRLQEEASSKEIYDLQSKLSDAQDAALHTSSSAAAAAAAPPPSLSPSPREEALTKQLEEVRSALNAAEGTAVGLRKERDDTVTDLQNRIRKLEQGHRSDAAAARAVSDELRIAQEALARVETEKEKVGSMLQDQIRSLEKQLSEKSDHLDRLAAQYGEVIEELAARHLAEATAGAGNGAGGVGDGHGLRDSTHVDTTTPLAHTSSSAPSSTAQGQQDSSVPTSTSSSSSSSEGHVAVAHQEVDSSVGDSVLNVLNWFR